MAGRDHLHVRLVLRRLRAFLTLLIPAFLGGLALGWVAREQGLNVAAATFLLFCAVGLPHPFWRIPPVSSHSAHSGGMHYFLYSPLVALAFASLGAWLVSQFATGKWTLRTKRRSARRDRKPPRPNSGEPDGEKRGSHFPSSPVPKIGVLSRWRLGGLFRVWGNAVKTDYIAHDREYLRRRAKGDIGWNDAETIADNLAILTEAFAAPHFPRSGRLLEMGCGAGDMALGLAALGYDVSGVDIAPAAVAWARGQGPRARPVR